MKTKINVSIHKSGEMNNNILSLVASINEGKGYVEMEDVIGWVKSERLIYSAIRGKVNCKVENEKLHITEDEGESWTLTLEWTTVVELINEPENNTP